MGNLRNTLKSFLSACAIIQPTQLRFPQFVRLLLPMSAGWLVPLYSCRPLLLVSMIESAKGSLPRWVLYHRIPPFRLLSNHLSSPIFTISSWKEPMDIANSLLQLVNNLWGLASRPLGYICNLKENVRSLEGAKNALRATSNDVKRSVEREEGGGDRQRTDEVANWLDTVQEFLDRVDQVLREAEDRGRIKCLSRCLPPNCWSSYNLGKRVDRMLNEARDLQQKKGEIGDYTLLLPSPPAPPMPMEETVGLDISLNEVWKWLVDETQVGVFGLFGPGGVGKTTLMKRIKEKLSCANRGFEVVIWVVVSREVNEDNIRDTIRRSLRISDESWNQCSTEQRVDHLHQALTQKKFLLLIDDLWERLDLLKIGVHRASLVKGSKVVFTTRLKRVCNLMKADETFEVQCLTREEALKLFEMNVGKSLVDFPQEIRPLAMKISEECKGLPLALITVGRAMAGKEKLSEWTHALRTLENNPHRLEDMEEKVYRILEFSYNSLKDDIHRTCFLYCCLFPEDYLIRTDRLIELWIGEGLVGDTNDVYSMRDEGEAILEVLKRACLLESERHKYDEDIEYVKMHDVIRDMATWIARDRGQKENKLLVIEKEDRFRDMISKWGEAEKVSLWRRRIQNIDRISPQCSQLKTLFIRETSVTVVPRGFFHSMTACLTLLDLSYNREIKSFPEEICDLINLQYLNLSSTRIKELPKEIKKLTQLRWLLLDNMDWEIQIPTGAIASLPLNVLSLWHLDLLVGTYDLVNEEEIVEELGGMEYLTDLSIIVYEPSSTLKIFKSSNIRKCIRRAWINGRENELTSISISYSPAGGDGGFLHLQELRLMGCRVLREMEIPQGTGQAPFSPCFPNLVEVLVEDCDLLLNLSWLVHAPKVRKLHVYRCDSMEKIIGDGITPDELAASGLFSCLQDLRLRGLPKLTSICDHALSFPPRASLFISDCDGLRKLPLHPNDARERSFWIEAKASWWAEFEWDPAARVTFQLDRRSRKPEIGEVMRWTPAREMTFGEAMCKMKDMPSASILKIGFRPSGSGPTE